MKEGVRLLEAVLLLLEVVSPLPLVLFLSSISAANSRTSTAVARTKIVRKYHDISQRISSDEDEDD